MSSIALTCSQEECKDKCQNLDEALTLQLQKCEKCENGIFKENLIATRTYQSIATAWAIMHNALTGRSIA
jgi:hypothetical protein